jgi:electron transport complex protein RnfB
MTDSQKKTDRRGFVGDGLRVLGAIAIGGTAAAVASRKGRHDDLVWQIDPDECMACGNCATYCVLDESAVKAVQFYPMCAMCDPCPGYFDLGHFERSTAAENQLCPTGAIERRFIADQAGAPRYEYFIDEPLCIGCGKCVKGCAMMNGSLYLQVRHDRCVHCNQCAIAVACPTQAFRRVPADEPYLLKRKAREILMRKAGDA